MADAQQVGVIRAISRYPVKSMQGEALDVGTIHAGGLDGDRSWGVIDAGSGKVLTGKRVGQLLDGKATLADGVPRIELPDGAVLEGPGLDTDAALSEWLGIAVSLQPAPRVPPRTR